MENKKTKGQIEDVISKEVTKFYVKTMGVGPQQSRVYVLHDMVIVRLKGKLLPIEQKLLEGHRGIELVKDIRKAMHELMTEGISEIIKTITTHNVISSHSDVSTKTGEFLQVFIVDTDLELEYQNQK
jgi:uncharacterized protein YbcI